MTRIVVVSNRVGPLADTGRAGGLAVALVDMLRDTGGLWFGWSGRLSAEGTHAPLDFAEYGDVTLATIDLTEQDYALYYAGFANRSLWPTMHYRLDLADFQRQHERGYREVNRRFAERLAPMLKPDDVVWVHDYHFLLLGEELRRAGVANPIGFFLHIPFPVPEILTALPNHGDIVARMAAYDLVGFQTEQHLAAFRRYLLQEVEGRMIDDGVVAVGDRRVAIGAFPIGIDATSFSGFAATDEGRDHHDRVAQQLANRQQIIGVDRIDYSKGLPNRFLAFERLLEFYPENRGRVSLMQIAPPSRSEVRAYSEIQETLEGLSGRINGRFADLDWTPINFLTQSFPRRALAGIYRASRIGLVTPLRDGMNLVAKEYVAAQDPDDPGVLVLSRFAGAAEQMTEALIVNPYSIDDLADVLQRAVQMPRDERRERWRRLYDGLVANDAAAWSRAFVARLRTAAADNRRAADPTADAVIP